MSNPVAITLLASGARTVDGAGDAVELEDLRTAVRLAISVTTFTADDPLVGVTVPALTVTVQTRETADEPWRDVSEIEITATGRQQLSAGDLDTYVRAAWAIGTNLATATFAIAGEAHVVYCDPVDIGGKAVPERSIEELSASVRAEACIVVSGVAESYLRGSNIMPLVSWGEDLRSQTAKLAAAELFGGRGADTEGPDGVVFIRSAGAIKWFEGVAAGRIDADIVDSTPENFEGGSVVVSQPERGWGR